MEVNPLSNSQNVTVQRNDVDVDVDVGTSLYRSWIISHCPKATSLSGNPNRRLNILFIMS